MSIASIPGTVALGPIQQWRNFSDPRGMHSWLRDHVGPLAPIRSQGKDHILVLTSEGARQVFAADPAGYDPYFKEGFIGIAGPGSLWVLGGGAHRRERRLFAPAVRADHLRHYGSVIREIARHHLDQWQPGGTVRALDTSLGISRDVIMRLVFGATEPGLMQEGREILDRLRRSSNPLPIFVVRLQQPWFPPWRRYAAAKAAFSDWVDRVLDARRAQGEETDDVLASLMAARCDDGSPMRDEDIRDELNTILQGGHQTVAGALAWALYELGQHPEVLARLRSELEGAQTDPDQVVRLPYLAAVCNEAIRLHSVLAECPRQLAGPMDLLGYRIPAGYALVISIAAIHNDPGLYPEPDKFIPERFIERTYGPSEFLPFGGAHRRCLGAALADYEMRIALAEAVQRWDFETAGEDHEVRRDVAFGPRHGVRLRIKARRGPN